MSDGLDPRVAGFVAALGVRHAGERVDAHHLVLRVELDGGQVVVVSGNAPTSANKNAIRSARCMIVSKYSARPVLCSPMSRWKRLRSTVRVRALEDGVATLILVVTLQALLRRALLRDAHRGFARHRDRVEARRKPQSPFTRAGLRA